MIAVLQQRRRVCLLTLLLAHLQGVGGKKGLSGLDRFPDLSPVRIVSSYFSLALPILLCEVI